jgi:hypothetical protein
MTLDWVRLTLRLSRFELAAFGGLVGGFVGSTVVAAGWIDSLRPSVDCLGNRGDTLLPGCEAKLNDWYAAQSGIAGFSLGFLIFLSFAAGLFLGVPIVAHELETREAAVLAGGSLVALLLTGLVVPRRRPG